MQNKKKEIITELDEHDLQKFNQVLYLSEKFKFWGSNNDPEMNLYFWCVFSNRLKIAKLFWKIGKVFISKKVFLKFKKLIKYM